MNHKLEKKATQVDSTAENTLIHSVQTNKCSVDFFCVVDYKMQARPNNLTENTRTSQISTLYIIMLNALPRPHKNKGNIDYMSCLSLMSSFWKKQGSLILKAKRQWLDRGGGFMTRCLVIKIKKWTKIPWIKYTWNKIGLLKCVVFSRG